MAKNIAIFFGVDHDFDFITILCVLPFRAVVPNVFLSCVPFKPFIYASCTLYVEIAVDYLEVCELNSDLLIVFGVLCSKQGYNMLLSNSNLLQQN